MQIKSGNIAEKLALNHLVKQDLKLLYNNYHCLWGEIDLIMLDKNNTLVFVEVRKRINQDFGGAAESITRSKQQKIIKSALDFLKRYKQYAVYNCRFDVVLFGKNNTPVWLQNAFEA
jgi:putative endonuclease